MDPQIQALRTQIVPRRQVSETIYCTIKEGIATGLLPMGTRLREGDLAEVFDASRTPVREAIKKLEIEQLVETNGTSGSAIRNLAVDECLDTLEMLEILRGSACEMLLGRIPRSFLMVIEQNTRKGSGLTDSTQQYENNAEFHELMVKATGNSVLIKLHTQLTFLERMINNTILPVDYAPEYPEHHRLLVKAVLESDMDTLKNELAYSRKKVDKYMNQIVGAFLDVEGS